MKGTASSFCEICKLSLGNEPTEIHVNQSQAHQIESALRLQLREHPNSDAIYSQAIKKHSFRTGDHGAISMEALYHKNKVLSCNSFLIHLYLSFLMVQCCSLCTAVHQHLDHLLQHSVTKLQVSQTVI